MSVERPELSCLCARLKVVEELWLLLGEVSFSCKTEMAATGCRGHPPPLSVCSDAACLLLLHCFSSSEKGVSGAVAWFLWRRNRQGNANGGKIEHFPLTGSLWFEVKCTRAPGRKRSAFHVVVSVLVFCCCNFVACLLKGLAKEAGCELSVKVL